MTERGMVVGEGFSMHNPKDAVKDAIKQAVSAFEPGSVRVTTVSHDVIRRGEEYVATVVLAFENLE